MTTLLCQTPYFILCSDGSFVHCLASNALTMSDRLYDMRGIIRISRESESHPGVVVDEVEASPTAEALRDPHHNAPGKTGWALSFLCV